jgi:hypothetical protein
MTDILPIEGWAAIYDEVDLNGDIVAPGAFEDSLAAAGPGAVKLLYQHAAEAPIGRWRRFEERPKGLYARGEILLATQTAREAAALVEAGVLDGLSIGFRPIRASGRGGARRILKADLWEVSLVTFPMAPKARLCRRAGDEDEQAILAFAGKLRRAAEILSV